MLVQYKNILKGGLTMTYTKDPNEKDLKGSNGNNDNNRVASQSHVHEYLGSTEIFEAVPHNHRFAGVTSQVIPTGNSHIHQLLGSSDFSEGHLHEVVATTGEAIPVDGGRHVHFVYGKTTLNLGHVHRFIFATLIDSPTD